MILAKLRLSLCCCSKTFFEKYVFNGIYTLYGALGRWNTHFNSGSTFNELNQVCWL